MNQQTVQQEEYAPIEVCEEVALLCTTLERDLYDMDKSYDRSKDLRSAITEKMFASVVTMDLDFKDDKVDAEQFEAKMRAVEALRGLLNDQDKSIATRVGVKMKQRDQETHIQLGVNVSQLVQDLQASRANYTDKTYAGDTETARETIMHNLYLTHEQDTPTDGELLTTSDVTELTEEIQNNFSAEIEI